MKYLALELVNANAHAAIVDTIGKFLRDNPALFIRIP